MSRVLQLIGLSLPILSAVAFASSQARDPTAAMRQALDAAQRSLQQNEPEIAESSYRSALREGWLVLGALATAENDLAAAARAFERAASSATDDRRPLLVLALVELQVGRAGEATTLLRRLAARNPADVDVRQSLARALAATGNFDEAIQELEELRALVSDHLETLFSLATAYLRQGRLDAAQPLLDQLATERPGPQTDILIGRTYRDHAHYELARRHLLAALEKNPAIRRAHYYLGTVELLAEGRGRVDEAIRHFRDELAVNPDDPMTNLYLGIGLVESRLHAEALAPLELAAQSDLAMPDAHQFLGRAYLALDRPAEAVVALERALELARDRLATDEGASTDESQLSSIHYQLALALRRTGDPTAAATHFELARDYSAQLAETSRDVLSRYLNEEVRPSESEQPAPPIAFPALRELTPEQRQEMRRSISTELARTYLNLGIFKTRSRRFEGAAELLATAAALAPDLPQVQHAWGVALFNAGRYEEAKAPLARVLQNDRENAETKRMLALAHLNTGSYAEAVELLESDPERQVNPSLEYAYGVALVRSGRAGEAQPVFARLLAENSDWPELNVVIGQAHAQQGDYEAAVRSLRRALELKADVPEANASLGDIYLRQGKLAEAEAALRAELAAHPEDERSRYTLAVVLDLNRNQDEAKRQLRAHLEARPMSADGRYLLGKILLAEGSAEDALEQLELAADLAPEDPNIHYQLGQALLRLGRSDEAEQEFELFRTLKRARPEAEES